MEPPEHYTTQALKGKQQISAGAQSKHSKLMQPHTLGSCLGDSPLFFVLLNCRLSLPFPYFLLCFSATFGFSFSFTLSSPCAFTWVQHTGPKPLPCPLRPMLNVKTQRKERRLERMRETQDGDSGSRMRKKNIRHRGHCLG